MNEVKLTGRFTKDPTLKNIGAKGTTLCEFSLAINSGKGEQKTAHFFECKSWKAVAGQIADNYRKGDLVDVKGFLTQEVWTQSDGQKRSKVVIVVMSHRIPGSDDDESPPERKPAQAARKPDPPAGASVGDIDIPFSPDCQWV